MCNVRKVHEPKIERKELAVFGIGPLQYTSPPLTLHCHIDDDDNEGEEDDELARIKAELGAVEFLVPTADGADKAIAYEATITPEKLKEGIAKIMECEADGVRVNYRLNTFKKGDRSICLDTEADLERLWRAVHSGEGAIADLKAKAEKTCKVYKGVRSVEVALGDRGSVVSV